MFTKILIPLLITGIVGLSAGGAAYAISHNLPDAVLSTLDAAAAPHAAAQGLAKITAIRGNQLTVETRQGKSLTILVNETTRYRDLQGSPLTFGDLQVGRWVTGKFQRDNGQTIARLIVLFPANFDPQQVNRRAAGEVTAISENSFSLHTARGEDLSIGVDANTVYAGIASLDEMEVGMRAGVGLKEQGDGSLTAVLVGARFPLIRHAGQVTAVNPAGRTFSLTTRQGEQLTFSVNDQTRFISQDGSIHGLSELTTEMAAMVGARQQEDGSYLAIIVAAGVRPNFDLTVGGKITAIQATTLSLQTRDGQTYTFQITADTRFHSRGGKVNSLDDLRLGMRIGVGAQDLGNGQYRAVVVLARDK